MRQLARKAAFPISILIERVRFSFLNGCRMRSLPWQREELPAILTESFSIYFDGYQTFHMTFLFFILSILL